jgi:hypothetical protein
MRPGRVGVRHCARAIRGESQGLASTASRVTRPRFLAQGKRSNRGHAFPSQQIPNVTVGFPGSLAAGYIPQEMARILVGNGLPKGAPSVLQPFHQFGLTFGSGLA